MFHKNNNLPVDVNKINNKFISNETKYNNEVLDIGKLKVEFDNLNVRVLNHIAILVEHKNDWISVKKYKKLIKK